MKPPAASIEPIPREAFLVLVAGIEAMIGRRALHSVRTVFTRQSLLELTDSADALRFQKAMVDRITAQMPTSRAVEATVGVRLGVRMLMCAIRLDKRTQWRCTGFSVVGLQPGARA